jgi:hypothetical protein
MARLVYPLEKILRHKNSVCVGQGNIRNDIQQARLQQAEKYRCEK